MSRRRQVAFKDSFNKTHPQVKCREHHVCSLTKPKHTLHTGKTRQMVHLLLQYPSILQLSEVREARRRDAKHLVQGCRHGLVEHDASLLVRLAGHQPSFQEVLVERVTECSKRHMPWKMWQKILWFKENSLAWAPATKYKLFVLTSRSILSIKWDNSFVKKETFLIQTSLLHGL